MKSKKWLSAVLFLGLAALTFYVIFKNQDIDELFEAVRNMHKGYLCLAVATALFFVSAEGILIWYMLRALEEKVSFWGSLKYAFIGFFYSGITPSATGGQPMQLYHMSKDGYKIGHSTVVLLSAAVFYKLVLVLMGIGICIFWWTGLRTHLGDYLPIYFLGLFLNAALVVALLAVMLNGPGMEKFLCRAEARLVKMHLLKSSETRQAQIHTMIAQYHNAVQFLKTHVKSLLFLMLITILQRCAVFGLTYFVYRGLGLSGTNAFVIMALQAVVYISVDMLPLPGSQGITEVMYAAVFGKIFTGSSLMVSMCISRGLNFYLPLLISAGVAAFSWWHKNRKIVEDKEKEL